MKDIPVVGAKTPNPMLGIQGNQPVREDTIPSSGRSKTFQRHVRQLHI